ncbi:hypothetical protein IscW_ISCW018848, partial [Ixodes scapularis]
RRPHRHYRPLTSIWPARTTAAASKHPLLVHKGKPWHGPLAPRPSLCRPAKPFPSLLPARRGHASLPARAAAGQVCRIVAPGHGRTTRNAEIERGGSPTVHTRQASVPKTTTEI